MTTVYFTSNEMVKPGEWSSEFRFMNVEQTYTHLTLRKCEAKYSTSLVVSPQKYETSKFKTKLIIIMLNFNNTNKTPTTCCQISAFCAKISSHHHIYVYSSTSTYHDTDSGQASLYSLPIF